MYLSKDVKDNRVGFFKYISNKRKTRENVSPLLNEAGTLATGCRENGGTECLLYFSLQSSPQESLPQETRDKVWIKEVFLLIGMNFVRDNLDKLLAHRSAEGAGGHRC